MYRNSANRVILVGNLGTDPELKTTSAKRNFTTLSLATNYSWRSGNGDFKNRVDWFRIICWGKLADYASKLEKGRQVFVEGSLRTREWTDKNSVKRFITEVYADSVTPLGRKKDNGDQEGAEAHPDEKTGDDVPF